MSSKGLKFGILAGKIKKKFGDTENREDTTYHGKTVDEDALVNQKATVQTGQQKMTKSSSMGSISNPNDTSSDMIIVDQDDIITLTQDVKCFSDGLARLKAVFNDCTESPEDFKVTAHERLGEVLSILKNILHRYPALQSTELFQSSGTLITKVKSHNYEDPCNDEAEHAFCEAIDQLALAFSSSVSEYLMGDLETSFHEEKDAKAKSYDNLLSPSKSSKHVDEEEQPEVHLSAEEMDTILFKLQEGVDVALQRAYAWKKYMKDISQYIERKAQLEVEYSQKLSRLAASVKRGLSDEAFLPLQSVYCTSLSQDIDYASTCQATQAVLQTVKFVVPLTERRTEHDKMRKYVKDTWAKEMKKMQESVQNLRKAQLNYVTRQQEYEKAKEQSNKIETDMSGQSSNASTSSKIDKRRKTEEDALHKAVEAETTYKACVAEANSRQQELEKIKSELLARVREELDLCDQVIQSVTIEYFRLLQTVSTPVPVQYHTLLETSKQYTPGVQYGEYIRRLSMQTNKSQPSEPFVFEPYVSSRDHKENERKNSTQSGGSGSSEHHSPGGSPTTAHKKDRYRIPVNAWGQGYMVPGETEGTSPNSSPFPGSRRQLGPSDSLEGLAKVENGNPQADFLAIPRTEGVDLHGILQVRGKRRNTTFGVDFQEQVEQCRSAVPPIVTKCLKEIEKRGMTMKGIYRVSVVKSKMESLCQQFERNPELVDLEDEHPNVISNVLKLYLRELPEPLLTFKLYSEFVHLAKESMSGSIDKGETICRLGDLIAQLPYSNFRTCAMLMHHLNRVTTFSSQNQMNASNLGIVFAPTLLRPLEGTASLASLVDTPHQTRIIELLIENVKDLFGPETDHQLIPGQTPIQDIADSESETQLHVSAPQLSSFKSPQLLKQSTVVKSTDKSDSAKSSDKPVEHLLQTAGSANGDTEDSKNSDADFVLPGSAHCDKKDTNTQSSPTITISEGEETGDLDLHSSSDDDDDLPDTLLPDDSNPSQHASQAAFPVSYIKGGNAIAVPTTSTESMETQNLHNDRRRGRPSPPLHLKLSKDPESKINVPEIKILESTPTRDHPPQVRFNIPASMNNGQRSKPKILVPSLQSLASAEKRNSKSTAEKLKENVETENIEKNTQGPQSSILASNLQKSDNKGSSRSPSLLRKFMATLEQSIDKISTIQSNISDKKQSPPVQHKIVDSNVNETKFSPPIQHKVMDSQTTENEAKISPPVQHKSADYQITANETKLPPSVVHRGTENLEFVPAQSVTPLSSSYATVHQGLQLSPLQSRKNAPSSNSAQLFPSLSRNVPQNSQFSPSISRKSDLPTTSSESKSFQLSPSSLRRSAVESVQSLYGDPDYSNPMKDSNVSERSPMPSIKPPLQQSLFQGQAGFKPATSSSGNLKTSLSVEETPFKINPPVFDASQSLAKSLPSPVLQRQSAAQSSPLTVKQGLVSPNLSPILPRHPPVQFKLSLVTLPTSVTDTKSKSPESDDIGATSTLKATHETTKISNIDPCLGPVSQVEHVPETDPQGEQSVPGISPNVTQIRPGIGPEVEQSVPETESVDLPTSTKSNITVTSESVIVCTSQKLDVPASTPSINDTSLSDSVLTNMSNIDGSSVASISPQIHIFTSKDNADLTLASTDKTGIPLSILMPTSTDNTGVTTSNLMPASTGNIGITTSNLMPASTDNIGIPTSNLLPTQQSLSMDSKQPIVKKDPISPPVPPRLFPDLQLSGTAPVDVSNVSAFCSQKSTPTESESPKDGQKSTVSSLNRIDKSEKVDKRVEKSGQVKTEVKPAKVRPPIPSKPAVTKMSVSSCNPMSASSSNPMSGTATSQTTQNLSSTAAGKMDSTPTTLDMTIRSADVSEIRGKLSPRYRVKVKNTVAPTSTTQAIPSVITSVIPPNLSQMDPKLGENQNTVSKNVPVSDFAHSSAKFETKDEATSNISDSVTQASHTLSDTRTEVPEKVTSHTEVDVTSDTDEKVMQSPSSEVKATDNSDDLSQGLSVSDSTPPAPDMTVKYAGTGRGRPTITTKTTLSPAKVGVPGKMPKGPSGIVMGKADIMRGRGGNTKSTVGPNSTARRPSKGSDVLPGQTKVKGTTGSSTAGPGSSSSQRRLSSGTGTYPPTGVKSSAENKPSTVSCSSCNRKRNSTTDVSMPSSASSLTVQSGKSGSKVSTSQKSVAGRKSPNDQSKSSKSDVHDGKKSQVQKVPPMKRGPGSAVKEKRTPFFV